MPSRLPGATGRAAMALVTQVGGITLTGWDGAVRLLRSLLPGERFRAAAAIQQVT